MFNSGEKVSKLKEVYEINIGYCPKDVKVVGTSIRENPKRYGVTSDAHQFILSPFYI
jgi:hypothetical protein